MLNRALYHCYRDCLCRLRHAARAWDAFWFTPADPINLGVLRILSGLMLLYTHFVWGLRLEAFFGPGGWQDSLLIQVQQQESSAWSFWWYVPPEWLQQVHWTCMGLLLLYTLGVFTRVTSIAAFLIVISYATRSLNANFGLDQINTLLTFYLMLGPSGATLSLDCWWASRRRPELPAVPRTSARVALRLIQLHMCVIYLFAALAKLKGDAWWDGNAIWMSIANAEYRTLDLTWLAWHPWLGELITHVSVAWELSFCVLVWNRHWRPLVLAVGIMMHLGIGAFLGMWTFGLVMIITYVAFLSPDLLHMLIDPFTKRGTMTDASKQTFVEPPSGEQQSSTADNVLVRVGSVLMLAVLVLSGCEGGSSPQRVLLEQGKLYIAREDFPRAIDVLTQGLELAPDDGDLLYERARAYELSDQLELALADYTRATEVKPGFGPAHNNRGAVLARLQRFEEAARSFSQAVEIDPKDALAIRNRGLANHDLGRTEEGLADFDRAIALDPGSAEPWFMKGNLCLDAGRHDEAIRCFTEAVRLNPQHAGAWLNRSQAYAAQGRTDLAEQDQQRAVAIDPALAAPPEPVTAPSPEPVAAPSPEPVAAPAPEPVAAPAPEPVAEAVPAP